MSGILQVHTWLASFILSALPMAPCSSLGAAQKINWRWSCYKSSTVHFPIHSPPLAYPPPPCCSSCPPPSPVSPSRSLFSHKQQSCQTAGPPKRAARLSASEHWKPATGAMKYIKSFPSEHTCTFTCSREGCVCVCVFDHLNAGDINIDPRQPLKLASKTVLIPPTPLEGSATPFLWISPHIWAFLGIFHLFILSPMGLFSPTALPWSFTLFKAFSASKSLLFGSRLLLVFVVWAAFLGRGLILAVISCIFALCHLCQLAVFSLRHTSHTAFVIHFHPAAARRVSAAYKCVFWREVCLLVHQGRAWIRTSPYSSLTHSVNFNANGKSIAWLWKTSR